MIVEGFELSSQGICASVDGHVVLCRWGTTTGWTVTGNGPSNRGALLRAGIDVDTPFPTRCAALETAASVLGSESRWRLHNVYYAIHVDGAPLGRWIIAQNDRRRWRIDRYDESAGWRVFGEDYPSRRAAMADLRERGVEERLRTGR